jgi:hypothetical protein
MELQGTKRSLPTPQLPLQEYIPADKLAEVKRVLFGANQGKPVAALDLPKALQELAEEQAFDLQAYKFGAAAEQFRTPRLVKVGLIQNAVVKPTTAPFAEQRQVRNTGKEISMRLQPFSTGLAGQHCSTVRCLCAAGIAQVLATFAVRTCHK